MIKKILKKMKNNKDCTLERIHEGESIIILKMFIEFIEISIDIYLYVYYLST